MYAILEMRGTKPESAPIEIGKDTVLEVFFKVHVKPQSKQRFHTKRRHSSNTMEFGDLYHVRKREE